MKILILAPQPFFQNRGTPIAVRMLAEELQSDGHDVDLLVFHEGEDVDLGRINLHRTIAIPGISNIGPGFSIKKIICDFLMLLKSIRLSFQTKYDVVHAVEESVFIAMFLRLFFQIPYIYDIDSWMSDQLINKYSFLRYFRSFFYLFEKAAVHYSSGAIAVCQALEEKVKLIDDKKPLLRLEDVSLLNKVSTRTESLNDIVSNSGPIILYVGNLERYQGIELLLKSFAILNVKEKKSNLVMIGGSRTDIEKYKLQTEELAIVSRVFFIGPRPISKLGMYLEQADLLVSPRVDGENTPMKIYSYMASGIPIVATRIKSHTQVLNDQNALLADPTVENMAEVLQKGFTEAEKTSVLAKFAQETAKKHYSRSAFRQKLTAFYSEISNVWNLRI